jgi:hypothetical protein
MVEKNLSENKKKYHAARHHAWAGSVFLAILLAIRIFFETSDTYFEHMNIIILLIGAIIVVYTLTALFYTYKYRSGLTLEEKNGQVQAVSDDVEKERIHAEVEKERLKVEKKKAKAKAKREKKSNKK